MRKDTMSFQEKHDIYVFNCERRESLLNEALKQSTPEEQMQFVVDYFLNKLDTKTIAKIDGVEESKVVPFKYDYSYLEDYGSDDIRRKEVREWGRWNYGFNLSPADIDNRQKEQVRIYPAIFALKMGTCVMFASEIQRFAYDFGMAGEIAQKIDVCYDKFQGTSTENKPISTDRLIKMHHFYNIISSGEDKFKIDIAGFLTAEDFNKNHPEYSVDLSEFYFSRNLGEGPFAKLTTNGKVLNFDELTQKQPQ